MTALGRGAASREKAEVDPKRPVDRYLETHGVPKSQLALSQMLSSYPGLQAIVAASFDDSDTALKSTNSVEFEYIRLGEKSITPAL